MSETSYNRTIYWDEFPQKLRTMSASVLISYIYNSQVKQWKWDSISTNICNHLTH